MVTVNNEKIMMKHTKAEFLKLMNFPKEWLEWEMYPDELFEFQISAYEPGNERGSEHDRYGAFHWWIRRDPPEEAINKLFKLTFLDPKQLMAEDARKYLRKCSKYKPELEQ
jgi:hypothetical protein